MRIDIEGGTEKDTYTIIDYTAGKKNINQTPEEILNYFNNNFKSEDNDYLHNFLNFK